MQKCFNPFLILFSGSLCSLPFCHCPGCVIKERTAFFCGALDGGVSEVVDFNTIVVNSSTFLVFSDFACFLSGK